jgi:hypothetical protein
LQKKWFAGGKSNVIRLGSLRRRKDSPSTNIMANLMMMKAKKNCMAVDSFFIAFATIISLY